MKLGCRGFIVFFLTGLTFLSGCSVLFGPQAYVLLINLSGKELRNFRVRDENREILSLRVVPRSEMKDVSIKLKPPTRLTVEFQDSEGNLHSRESAVVYDTTARVRIEINPQLGVHISLDHPGPC